MTTAVEPATERADVRTIVGGGLKLGVITAVGVAAFALISRGVTGTVETVVQALLVLLGGVVFSYLPAFLVRPRNVDGIAWAALVGLLGALTFTVLDTAVLRPLGLYHWTWDQIGGGSGFWYVSVWWMGSALLAWLGAWVVAVLSEKGTHVFAAAGQTLGVAVVVFAVVALTRIAPAHAAVMALAWTLALIVHVPVAYALAKR
jgi:hypothetical protein